MTTIKTAPPVRSIMTSSQIYNNLLPLLLTVKITVSLGDYFYLQFYLRGESISLRVSEYQLSRWYKIPIRELSLTIIYNQTLIFRPQRQQMSSFISMCENILSRKIFPPQRSARPDGDIRHYDTEISFFMLLNKLLIVIVPPSAVSSRDFC